MGICVSAVLVKHSFGCHYGWDVPDTTRGRRGRGAHLRLQHAHLHESSTHGSRERARRARLDLDLRHLERAERNVSEELGFRQPAEPDRVLVPVLGRHLFTGAVHVLVLEGLVETVIEEPLKRVAGEGSL